MTIASKLVLLLVLAAVAVWARAQDDPVTEVPNGPAPVDSVVLDGETAVASGFLADGCVKISETAQTVEGNTIMIDLLTIRLEGGISCIQMLVAYEEAIPIDTSSLAPGTYQVSVNGVLADETLNIGADGGDNGDGESEAPAAGDSALATLDCPIPTVDAARHVDEAGRYCFLYPADYDAASPQPSVTIVSAPADLGENGERPRLTVATADAVDRTLDDVVAEQQARFADTVLTFAETRIGGQPALLTERIPGRTGNRQAFVIWKGMLYTLAAQPVDSDFTEATAATNALWAQVVDSFTFYGDLVDTELDALGLVVTHPAAWTLEESGEDGADALYTLRRDRDTFVIFGTADDLPVGSLEALGEALLDRLLTEGEGNLSTETVTVAGQDALVISGVSGVCRLLYLPDAENERVIRIGIQEPDCDGSLQPLIDALRPA